MAKRHGIDNGSMNHMSDKGEADDVVPRILGQLDALLG